MREAGFIYKGSYDGWYCIHEETFFTEDSGREGRRKRLVAQGAHLCLNCHRERKQALSRESWFLPKLSAFQDKLLEYAQRPISLVNFRANEVPLIC